MTTPPPDGTVWMFYRSGTYYSDLALRDGVMMFEPRNGDKPTPILATVAELRRLSHDYIEIPPDGHPAHSAG